MALFKQRPLDRAYLQRRRRIPPALASPDTPALVSPDTPEQLTAVVITGNNTGTTASVTPAPNALVLAIVSSHNGGGHSIRTAASTFGVRLDGQGRGWKPLNNERSFVYDVENINSTYGADATLTQVFWAVTTASPGSGTLTVTTAPGIQAFKIRLVQITNVDLYSPIRQWHFDGEAASAASITRNLPRAPLANNMLVSVVHGREATTTIDPAAGWTELSEDTSNLAPSNIQYRTGTTETSFGASFGTTLTDGIAVGAIEVRGPIANAVPDPTTLVGLYHTTPTGNTQLLPETGSITVGAGDLILVATVCAPGAGSGALVSGITSTFDVQAPGWQRAMFSPLAGSANVRVEWWYAIAATAGTLTGTLTVTWDVTMGGVRGGWVQSLPAGTFNAASPIRQSAAATIASLTGGTALSGEFDQAPLPSSRLIAAGMGTPNMTQLWTRPLNGWHWIGPAIEEGAAQTSYQIYSADETTFGGRFSHVTPTHDSTTGAVWGAIEVQAADGGNEPDGPVITGFDPNPPFTVGQAGVLIIGFNFGD
jgi:hypothetical protein